MDEESQQPRRGLSGRMARAFGRRSPGPVDGAPEAPAVEPVADEPGAPADTEWLDQVVEEFENRLAEVLKQAGEELYAQVERDLAQTEKRLRETERRMELNVTERLEGAVAEVRVQGDAQLTDELERVKEAAETPLASIRKVRAEAVQAAESAAARADKSASKAATQIEVAAEKLGVRARRQELKLVREETSKRMAGALARLEHQAEIKMAEVEAVRADTEALLAEVDDRVTAASDAAAELDRRLEDIGLRLSSAESRAEATAALIEDAMARLEHSIDRVEDAEQHVLQVSERAGDAARRIAELGEYAERAVDWEGRMAAATRTEADAAQRISDAERRLLDRIDPGAGAT
jgi:chromosome segregation ATPase